VKILVMADLAADLNSGAAGTEMQTVEGLRRLGHEVDTVWGDGLPHRIAHWNLHYLLELPWAYKAAMLERLKSTRYDVVQVNQPHGYLAAKALRDLGGGPVFVFRTHGLELRLKRELARWRQIYVPDEKRRSRSRLLASRILGALLARHSTGVAKYADGHVVSAGECATFLHEELGVPVDRIALIPTAAPEKYVGTPAPAMTVDRQLRLLHVGQYAYFKAPMIVAETFNRIAEIDDRAALTWVTSKWAHPQVRALLRGPARARVRLLDWMPQDRLIDVYDSHGIFLFPSFFEGFGKVFVEAMSRGLCVIAADNSAARDVIMHDKSGILVPTGNIDRMAQQCADLLNAPERAQALSREAALRAREYTWDRVARDTSAFFEKLSKSGAARPDGASRLRK